MLALACLVIAGCQTKATPREEDGSAAASTAGDALQMPLTGRMAGLNRAVSYPSGQRPVAFARHGSGSIRSADRTDRSSTAALGQELTPLRALVLGGLPIIFAGAVGAIGTCFDGRRRRPGIPSSSAGR
jgi:hypothetical protein